MIHSTYSSISPIFTNSFSLAISNSSLSNFSIHVILLVSFIYKHLFSVVSDILLFAKFSDQLSVLNWHSCSVFHTFLYFISPVSGLCHHFLVLQLSIIPRFLCLRQKLSGFLTQASFSPIYWLYGVHILPYFIHYCCEYTYKIPSEPFTYKSNCLIEISTWIFYQASNVCKKIKFTSTFCSQIWVDFSS